MNYKIMKINKRVGKLLPQALSTLHDITITWNMVSKFQSGILGPCPDPMILAKMLFLLTPTSP